MGARGGASRRAAIDAIECAYSLVEDDETWLEGISNHVLSGFDQGLGCGSYIARAQGRRVFPTAVARVGNTAPREVIVQNLVEAPNPEIVWRAHMTGGLTTHSETFAHDPPTLEHFEEQVGKKTGIHDVMAFLASDGVSTAANFCIGLPEYRGVKPHERRFWSRVGAHVAAGLRLREQLRAFHQDSAAGSPNLDATPIVEAILDPGGRVEHAQGTAQGRIARERLRQAVQHADRARGKLSKTHPDEAVGLWRGLVAGRWSLVDRFDSDGRRFVVACKNPIGVVDPRALSERERQVAHLVSLGRTNTLVAYELGLSEATVATHLASALAKLGLAGRAELCNTWAEITSREARRVTAATDPVQVDAVSTKKRKPRWLRKLTPRQREIALDVLGGTSNAEIARRRGISVNTVVNQLGTIFRRLGVGSRVELAALE